MSRRIELSVLAVLLLGCRGDEVPLAPHLSGVRADNVGLTEWTTPVNLGVPINAGSSELQVGIAPNGRSLYVASNRSEGVGDQDIWVSSKQADGTWGPLANLG